MEPREIEFRGIASEDFETSTDGISKGDWVYGYYVVYNEQPCILTKLTAECGGVGSGLVDCFVPIDLKTRGQYINRRDDYDKRMYDGDVYCITTNQDGKEIESVNRWLVECSNVGLCFAIHPRSHSDQKIKVLGDIHTTPELLTNND